MTATSDPFISAALAVLGDVLGDLRPSIAGAPPEALNWRPAGDDTNSIAVLAVHSLGSTRSWLAVAVAAPLPDRDRPSEFVAKSDDAETLLAFVERMAQECTTLLEAANVADWATERETHARSSADASERVTAAWALIHAMEHLREHVGQMALTRQLWERRG